MSGMIYEQARTIINMHSAPRFGHSSNIALLASSNEQQQDDYIQGVQLFCFFNLFILLIWTMILIILKIMGPSRVGCAAGGEVLFVKELRKQYDRATRKAIERRSWRVQTTFLISSVLLIVMAGLFLHKGLYAIGQALDEVYDINDSIERVTMRASDITQSLQRQQSRMQEAELHSLLNFETYCTDSTAQLHSLNMTRISETIRESLQEIDTFMETRVKDASHGLTRVGEATMSVDEAIYWFQQHEWKPRLCIVALIVVTMFLLIGLMLSRNNIAYNPYMCVEMYLLVPAFCFLLILSALATYAFGAGAIVNADFCAGGTYPGSPQGTIEEIMSQQGVSPKDMLYQSFHYYAQGCKGENPLLFLEEYRPDIKSTMDAADTFLSTAQEHGLETLSASCGADLDSVMSSVVLMKSSLQSIETSIQDALDLSSCYKVSPIVRKMLYGPVCSETVTALTWLFSTCFCISILGLIMLSVRAALYNATLRPPRKKMSKRRLKKEFNEYKEFMEQFYDNVHEWKLHPSPEKKKLKRSDSFDTDITAKPSHDTDIGSSNNSIVENPLFDETDSFYSSTPRSRRLARSFVSCVDSPPSEPSAGPGPNESVLRDRTNQELEPLSPETTKMCMPAAPTKAFKSLRRTSLGMKSARTKEP